MTIAVLRSLHAIIGEAIDDLERVYSGHGSSSAASSRRETPDEGAISTASTTSTSASTSRSTSTRTSESQDAAYQDEQSQDDDTSNTKGVYVEIKPLQFPRKTHKPTLSNSHAQALAYASPPPSPCVLTSTAYSETTYSTTANGLPSPIASASSRDSTSYSPGSGVGESSRANGRTSDPNDNFSAPASPDNRVRTGTSSGSSPTSPGSGVRNSTPPTPTPTTPGPGATHSLATDFPSLDAPCDLSSPSEMLTAHPDVQAAIGKIVAAAGQLAASVQMPFLTLCEATMGYHLPSCMRLLEASHVVEILREAGPGGAHVQAISDKNGVGPTKLAHILRLLATHHLLREVSPDVFAINRLSSLLDSGKTFEQLREFEDAGTPEMKYRETNGIAAFVGLCTDEIQKASAYMTDTYYLSASKHTRQGTDPVKAPFCFAFDTVKNKVGYFGWLEGEDLNGANKVDESVPSGSIRATPEALLALSNRGHIKQTSVSGSSSLKPHKTQNRQKNRTTPSSTDSESSGTVLGGHHKSKGKPKGKQTTNDYDTHVRADARETLEESTWSASTSRAAIGSVDNRYRLERFGKAMSGTDGWEAPGAVLNGFDWAGLPAGSIVVDVGGGIGSTSMLLATAFSNPGAHLDGPPRLKFVIQDRPPVCEMGEKAWKEKCPKLLEDTARFQVHDFFTPQPIRDAAVFLLRVVLHDWPDDFARRILLRLREAATPDTKLVIADFVLPLACPDDMGSTGGLEDIEGAESMLAPSPLLPNLGKASTNVYYMDLTMQVMFNSQERTLREMVALTRSAGWKVFKVTRTPGSMFGNIVAAPIDIPLQPAAEVVDTRPIRDMPTEIEPERRYRVDMEVFDRAGSRCGTPTFGSGTRLSSVEEALARFGGGLLRPRANRPPSSPRSQTKAAPPLKPALNLFSVVKKKMKPSPLSVPPVPSSPSPLQSPRKLPFPSTSPRIEPTRPPAQPPAPSLSAPRRVLRRLSAAHLHRSPSPPPPMPSGRHPPASPSPLSSPLLMPQSSPRLAPLSSPRHGPLSSPLLAPARSLFRRASVAHLRSGSEVSLDSNIPVPPLPPSFIPVRTSTGPNSGTLTAEANSFNTNGEPPRYHYSSASSIGSSPSGSRQSSMRRASVAHLPNLLQVPFRKRSGTVTAASATQDVSSSSRANDATKSQHQYHYQRHSRQVSDAASSRRDTIALASAPNIRSSFERDD